MNLSNNFVILAGAGFSVERGVPVMARYMETARQRYFEDRFLFPELKDSYSAMLEFHAKCRNSSWALNRDWDNIEELYTQAHLLQLSEIPDKEAATALCKDIAWCIWDVYRKTTGGTVKLKQIHGRLDGMQPVYITTNYDTLIEQCLSAGTSLLEPEYYYPGFEERGHLTGVYLSSNKTKSANPSLVPIIKLHGSANWFAVDDDDNNKKWVAISAIQPPDETRQYPFYMQSPRFDFSRLRMQVASHIGMEEQGLANLTPAIIPPMLGKTSSSPVITAQWKAAIDALKGAREIWIIGYSFPTTDAFMTRLLTAGISENHSLERVVIIDKQSRETWDSRLKALFPPVMLGGKVVFKQMLAARLTSVLADNQKHTWMYTIDRAFEELSINHLI